VQEGDVIKSFAGKAVSGPRELQEVVERAPLDSKQPLVIIRNGEQKTVQIAIAALPHPTADSRRFQQQFLENDDSNSFVSEDLGLRVTDLTDQFAQRFAGYQGVLVTGVEPGSVASRKGLQAGMLVRKVGKTEVRNVEQFAEALEKESLDKGIMLQIRTAEGNRFVVLRTS
jgi:serine protease Do